jgi:hypothetical protein
MMQAGSPNPQLMARLMQMRQGMGGGAPNMPQGNPMQANQMLNNSQPTNMGMGGGSGMTMGQPSPQIMQALLQRRRMMMGNPPGQMIGTMGQPPQMGQSSITPQGDPRMMFSGG